MTTIDSRRREVHKLDIAEAVQIAVASTKSKKSVSLYNKWRLDIGDRLKKPLRKKLTLRERLRGDKPELLHERLKRHRGK